jgi:adenosylmethionine-8-amino-7-oxononanoate aminotransferase
VYGDGDMPEFRRAGRWFRAGRWGTRPDTLVAAKGATSGYWPFGFAAASGEIHDTVMGRGGFVHGFTYSHAPAGAAVAREVLRILETEDLVEASRVKGDRLRTQRVDRLAGHAQVGEVRGRGLMVGIELVADRETRRAFPRSARLTESIVRRARDGGVLVYSGTGNANGVDGDTILLGPPFVVTDPELDRIVDVVAAAIEAASAEAAGAPGVAAATG